MVKIAIAGGSSSKSWAATVNHIFVPFLMPIQTSLRRLLMSLLRLANTRSCYYLGKYAKNCSPTHSRSAWLNTNKEASTDAAIQGTTWIQVDYQSQAQLTHALKGIHTLLSFVSEQEDPDSPLQKNLIKAAINAGVKRFAPNEWAT